MNFTTKTLISLIFGTITGVLIYNFLPDGYLKDTILVDGIFLVLGNGFIGLMRMLVVPLVFTSLVTGVTAIGDTKKLGKVGLKTVGFYLVTTAMAITVAIGIANIINPGINLDISSISTTEITIVEKEPLTTTILNLIPVNPIGSMATGDMIPIIVFAIFIGLAISTLKEKAEVVSRFFKEFNDIMMEVTMMVMKLAPIGVFALIARTFSTLGLGAFASLIKYMFSVLLGLVVQLLLVYMLLFYIFTKRSPIKFIKKFIKVIIFAFSTASSNATIPVNIETLENEIGVSKKISSFTIPLGATINMDGTAIMQGVAVVFAAQAYGITLGMSDYLTVILTATLASVGTAGVPGVGLIMLSMVFTSIGLPVEAIGLIMGIDRILDMARTCVNVVGDAVCTTIVAKQENEFNVDIFESTSDLKVVG